MYLLNMNPVGLSRLRGKVGLIRLTIYAFFLLSMIIHLLVLSLLINFKSN